MRSLPIEPRYRQMERAPWEGDRRSTQYAGDALSADQRTATQKRRPTVKREINPVHICAAVSAGIGCCLVVLALAGTALAASTTLTFREPEKGATFAFVDNPPRSPHAYGIPKRFSPGDEFIFTNPLEAEGKRVGKIRAICTAAQAASVNNLIAADFICNALAKVPGGTLVLVAPLTDPDGGTEGAVTGGTSQYAGAHGTFVVKEGRGFDTNTITLLE
jgi:hypothetical protein